MLNKTFLSSRLKILSLYFFGFLLLFLVHYYIVGNGVWGDGRYYFVFARSILIDHDLNFANECKVDPFAFDCNNITTTGLVFNKYALGPGLFWLPLMALPHLLILASNFLQLTNLPADGYGHLYRLGVGLGAITYGFTGLYLTYLTLEKRQILNPKFWFLDSGFLILNFGFLLLSSNLLFYLSLDPINSHSLSIGLAGIYFYLLNRYLDHPTILTLASLGLTVGALGLTRPQDLIFALPILMILFHRVISSQLLVLPALLSLLTFGFSLLASFSPQLLVWQIMFGKLNSPYFLAGEGFNWFHPQIFSVLFSFNNGLFIYSPIFLLALIGLILNFKTSRLSQIGLMLFILETYLIACWHGWWGGASYGGRMFLTLTPFFFLGLVQFYHWIKNYLSPTKLVLAGLGLIGLNWGLILRLFLTN